MDRHGRVPASRYASDLVQTLLRQHIDGALGCTSRRLLSELKTSAEQLGIYEFDKELDGTLWGLRRILLSWFAFIRTQFGNIEPIPALITTPSRNTEPIQALIGTESDNTEPCHALIRIRATLS